MSLLKKTCRLKCEYKVANSIFPHDMEKLVWTNLFSVIVFQSRKSKGQDSNYFSSEGVAFEPLNLPFFKK